MLLLYGWGRGETTSFERSMKVARDSEESCRNTARIGPVSNPANVSELGSSYRPPTAARKPMRFELVSNPESARALGYQWATLLSHADGVAE
jgi:hypothetical protein